MPSYFVYLLSHCSIFSDNTKFEGFEFQINAPIFSIAFNGKQKVNLKADFAYGQLLRTVLYFFTNTYEKKAKDKITKNQRNNGKIKLAVNVRDLGQSGFLSSPGYNGCDGLGGDQVSRSDNLNFFFAFKRFDSQVHRAKWTHYSDEYDLHGEPE